MIHPSKNLEQCEPHAVCSSLLKSSKTQLQPPNIEVPVCEVNVMGETQFFTTKNFDSLYCVVEALTPTRGVSVSRSHVFPRFFYVQIMLTGVGDYDAAGDLDKMYPEDYRPNHERSVVCRWFMA